MKSLCVYCGASMGRSGSFKATAEALGQELVRQDIRLVYGGGRV